MTFTRASSVVFCRHSVPSSSGAPLVPAALVRKSRSALAAGAAPGAQLLPNWYVLPALLIVNELASPAEANAIDPTAAVTTAAAILDCLSMMLLWWGILSWGMTHRLKRRLAPCTRLGTSGSDPDR